MERRSDGSPNDWSTVKYEETYCPHFPCQLNTFRSFCHHDWYWLLVRFPTAESSFLLWSGFLPRGSRDDLTPHLQLVKRLAIGQTSAEQESVRTPRRGSDPRFRRAALHFLYRNVFSTVWGIILCCAVSRYRKDSHPM